MPGPLELHCIVKNLGPVPDVSQFPPSVNETMDSNLIHIDPSLTQFTIGGFEMPFSDVCQLHNQRPMHVSAIHWQPYFLLETDHHEKRYMRVQLDTPLPLSLVIKLVVPLREQLIQNSRSMFLNSTSDDIRITWPDLNSAFDVMIEQLETYRFKLASRLFPITPLSLSVQPASTDNVLMNPHWTGSSAFNAWWTHVRPSGPVDADLSVARANRQNFVSRRGGRRGGVSRPAPAANTEHLHQQSRFEPARAELSSRQFQPAHFEPSPQFQRSQAVHQAQFYQQPSFDPVSSFSQHSTAPLALAHHQPLLQQPNILIQQQQSLLAHQLPIHLQNQLQLQPHQQQFQQQQQQPHQHHGHRSDKFRHRR